MSQPGAATIAMTLAAAAAAAAAGTQLVAGTRGR